MWMTPLSSIRAALPPSGPDPDIVNSPATPSAAETTSPFQPQMPFTTLPSGATSNSKLTMIGSGRNPSAPCPLIPPVATAVPFQMPAGNDGDCNGGTDTVVGVAATVVGPDSCRVPRVVGIAVTTRTATAATTRATPTRCTERARSSCHDRTPMLGGVPGLSRCSCVGSTGRARSCPEGFQHPSMNGCHA